jgi:Ca2+-transporting ATPase
VAVTGDGTNDAPALNYANVGVSMGSGTSVAKESSDIIVLDDSFSTIVTAVEWGRSIYRNIQRFIYFQLTVNLAALLTALAGPLLLNEEFPLTITQVLWINLIMDTLAALALASEPSDSGVMRDKPRKSQDFIVTKKMMRGILFFGLLIFFVGLAFLKYEDLLNSESGMSTYHLSIFFTLFVMMQVWNLFNARALGASYSPFGRLKGNKTFVAIISIIVLLQIIIVNFGGAVFRTEPFGILIWIMIMVVSFLLIIPFGMVKGKSKRAI